MNENEIFELDETRPAEDDHEVANMNEFDFIIMLMESRIIQPS